MDNIQKLLDFIRKGPMRNPSLGPVSREPEKPKAPLPAYKIAQQAKREAEASGRQKTMVEQVQERIAPPKSDEVPL